MAMRSFDVHDQTTFAELVIAPSREEAFRLARVHLASYRGQTSDRMTAIERLLGFGGTAVERLAAVIRNNVSGIAHLQADGTWLVLPAGIRPLAKAYPKGTKMHHFVDEDDYEVVLFAHSVARAADLYGAISHDYSVLPRPWLGSEWEAWLAVGIVRHERQATQRGVEGLGIYTDQGWQILPLDYRALGINPPDP